MRRLEGKELLACLRESIPDYYPLAKLQQRLPGRKLRAAAVHEAGHAVVARHAGFPVLFVTIETGEMGGLTRTLVPHKGDPLLRGASIMAGRLAERIDAHTPPKGPLRLSGIDRANLDEVLTEKPASERPAMARAMQECAADILAASWREVEALAAALLAEGTVAERQAAQPAPQGR